MSLDLFQTDNRDAINSAQRDSAPLLPAGFKESFDTSWDNAVLFGQSFAFINARNRAMDNLFQQAYDATRDERFRQDTVQFGNRFRNADGGHSRKTKLDVYNDIAAEHAAEGAEREASGFPPSTVRPITPEQLDVHAADLSRDARDAYKAMAARQSAGGGGVGGFAGTAAGTMVDPVNLLTFPLAAPEAAGIIKTGLTWAGIGGGTQAAIEAAGSPFREQAEPGYGQTSEPGANILEAGAFAGTLGATIKALGTGWRWYANKAQAPRTIRDAGNVLDSEAQVAETNPLRGPEGETAHRAALSKTLDDVVKGDAPNVDGIITPEMMDGYTSRLTPVMKARQAAIDATNHAALLAREDARLPGTMERLSELQLGDIRGAVDALDTGLAERQGVLTGQLEKARTAVTEQQAVVTQLRAELDAHRILRQFDGDVDAAREFIGNRAARSAEGDAEYGQVLAAFDAMRQAGGGKNVVQFGKKPEALERQIATREQRHAKAEARLEKLTETARVREATLPLRQVTAEARAATRKGRTTAEMAKAIDSLAEDGYGLKLDPTDTARLADRILKAPADELEVALRETTEELVDKARAQRALAPPTPFGEARPHEEQAAHALRITNVMRMRIQTLAREVGYAMPKEEAGAIAARLLEVKEPDALAILDELVLRPRTLAKTMAEPRPVVPEGIPTPPTAEAPKSSAQPAGFTTAKGSTYELHSDGTTTRNKAARSDVGHEGDSGVKARTERTVYVDDASLASALSAAGIQNLGSKGARVVIEDGKASLLTWNEAAGRWGRSPQSTEIKISDTPAVGKAPLELWKKAEDVPGHEAYRGMHAGNAITEVRGAQGRPAPHPDAAEFGFALNPERPAPDGPSVVSRTEFRQIGTEQFGQKTVSVNGEMVASADVIMGSDGNIKIQKIETLPAAQRKGYATQLVRDLQDEFPDARITTSMRTDQGSAFFREAFGSERGSVPLPRAYERAAAEQMLPKNVEKLKTDPEMTATVERDLQRMRAETPDKEIPVGVDKDGAPITRTVEEAAEDIEQRKALADEIRASCGPQPETVDEGDGGSTAAALAGAGAGGGGLLALGGGGETQAAEMKPALTAGYPTDEDAQFARDWGAFYGKDVESYANLKVARVLGTVQPGQVKGSPAKFEARSAEGNYLSDLMTNIMSEAKSRNIDLTKKENWPIADKIGNEYAKAAIVINRLPIAALGFDPSRVVMDTKIGDRVTIGGAYDPKEDAIYANLASPGTLVHEALHRGLEQLSKVPALQQAFRTLPDEESVVRYMMATQAGDPEKGSGSAGDRQRANALQFFSGLGEGRYKAALEQITTYAQQEIARRKPRGPR